jgi:hypothetical protein
VKSGVVHSLISRAKVIRQDQRHFNDEIKNLRLLDLEKYLLRNKNITCQKVCLRNENQPNMRTRPQSMLERREELRD